MLRAPSLFRDIRKLIIAGVTCDSCDYVDSVYLDNIFNNMHAFELLLT